MRLHVLAAVALTAAAAAIAQPIPGKPTAAEPASQRVRTLQATPGTVGRALAPIDWPAVQSAVKAQQLQRSRFREMKITPGAPQPSLPMLLPFEPSLLAAAVNVFPRPDSYSASLRNGATTVEVHGERRALTLARNDPWARLISAKQPSAMLAGASTPYALEKTEGGYDLTFNRFGAAYLVSVECANPETDEPCVKPDFVLKLGERMGLFGADHP